MRDRLATVADIASCQLLSNQNLLPAKRVEISLPLQPEQSHSRSTSRMTAEIGARHTSLQNKTALGESVACPSCAGLTGLCCNNSPGPSWHQLSNPIAWPRKSPKKRSHPQLQLLQLRRRKANAERFVDTSASMSARALP